MKKQILLDNLEQLETKEYTKLTPILVPETFEELKELCKGLKNIEIYNNSICVTNSDIILIRFYDDGEIRTSGGGEIVMENRTPAQMWSIIKGLIGE